MPKAVLTLNANEQYPSSTTGVHPMIYFDNAATSWPKPPGVAEAMLHFLNHVGEGDKLTGPGGHGHRLSTAQQVHQLD